MLLHQLFAKDAPELLNWLNNEIQTLGKDGRLKQAYEKPYCQFMVIPSAKAISWLNINNSSHSLLL